MEKRHRLIIDIGNSRVKYYFAATTYYDLESICSSLESGYNHVIDCFIIAAKLDIAEAFLDKIKEFFSLNNICLGISYLFNPEKDSLLTETYAGLGGDRIAKLTGALAKFPGTNIMLMDFGTATTLNLASLDGKFQGGFINLGLEASLKAIADQLRGFEDYSESKWFKSLLSGKAVNEIFSNESTEKAVIEGAYREHLALIQYYKSYASEKFKGEKFISIATGGNAKLFSKEFDKSVDSSELLEAFCLTKV